MRWSVWARHRPGSSCRLRKSPSRYSLSRQILFASRIQTFAPSVRHGHGALAFELCTWRPAPVGYERCDAADVVAQHSEVLFQASKSLTDRGDGQPLRVQHLPPGTCFQCSNPSHLCVPILPLAPSSSICTASSICPEKVHTASRIQTLQVCALLS